MSMSQLQHTMATLRMSLAEIQNKEQQLDSMINQFRTQLRRLPRQVIYGQTSLDVSLSSMGEIEERPDAERRWTFLSPQWGIEERLADAEATRRRLMARRRKSWPP